MGKGGRRTDGPINLRINAWTNHSSMNLSLTSPSFRSGEPIPRAHTDHGAGLSPPLAWEGVPRGAKTLALIMEDLDAPDPRTLYRSFAHWVVYNLQASRPALPPGLTADNAGGGVRFGYNSDRQPRYLGPRPPASALPHRYAFRLYALDSTVGDGNGSTAAVVGPPAIGLATEPLTAEDLRLAMTGHVLDVAELIATHDEYL
jgi:Raf kinase inhibitor-like YbhB/YbcL family protein